MIESFIKNSGQPLENFFGWLSPETTSSIPVKELSRSPTNPEDQDIKNLIQLLKYVNQTRDFVFVMEPQLPVRTQEGKFPVPIVSYSDSDWAGCPNSMKVNKWFIGFNVQCQYSSRQAGLKRQSAPSSAESELNAMTQAAVESLAIKNFVQEFNSTILSSSVSIVIQTDSSALKIIGLKIGDFKEIKAHRAQISLDSR